MKLLDVCEFIVDCPHSTAKDEGTGYPLIRTPNIGKGILLLDSVHRVSEEVYNKRNARAVPKENDLIFAREAPAGNVAIIRKNQKVCLGQRTVLLRPNTESVVPAYLNYFLLAPKQQYGLLGTANGATVAHVNIPTIRNLEINLPDIETQHRIASILSAYDDLIENNQKQIKLLEEAAQRLYKEWFVDLRFPNYENTPVVDGVPEGWKIEKIGNFVSTTSGGTPSRTHKEYYESGTNLWVKTQELKDSYIIDTDEKITDEAIKKSSAKIIPNGSLLLAMYGATIGKLGIANCDLTCNQACCVFLFENDIWKREYLYCWLIENRVFLVSQGKGAAQPNLSQALIKAIDILIPNENLVKRFSKIASVVFQKKCNLEIQIKSLNEARDRLLPKLMSGELEV